MIAWVGFGLGWLGGLCWETVDLVCMERKCLWHLRNCFGVGCANERLGKHRSTVLWRKRAKSN
jgi:hypothetical protein